MFKKKVISTTLATTLLLSSLSGVASAQEQEDVVSPQITTVAQIDSMSFEKVYQTLNLSELVPDLSGYSVTSVSPTQFVTKTSIDTIVKSYEDGTNLYTEGKDAFLSGIEEIRSTFGDTIEMRFTKKGNGFITEIKTTEGWVQLGPEDEAIMLNVFAQGISLERSGGYFHDTLNHWSEPYVQYLYQIGAINGVNATTFNPNGNITRGQLVAMIARTLDTQLNEAFEEYAPYNDIKGHQFGKEISVSYDYGLLEIFDDRSFSPNKAATREEVAAIVYAVISALYEIDSNSNLSFKDANTVDPLAKEAIAFFHQEGIISGYDDGTFKPKNNVTRAQFAKILTLTMLKMNESE